MGGKYDATNIVTHEVSIITNVTMDHMGYLGTAVEKIGEHYGSQPGDLIVGVGPSICSQCYQVGEEVRKQFLKSWGGIADTFFKPDGDRYLLDLWAANQWILRGVGVVHIEQSNMCTAENLDEWYSYRKEKGATGRFGIVIALKRD